LLDIFGYKNMDELKSAPPQKYYSTESYADYLKMMEKYGRGEIIPDHVDIDIIRKDSAVRHLQALFKEVFWDGKQQYQSLYNDITENKKVEVALRESEEKYRTIFESANDILMLLDTNGKIVDINGRLKDIGGYERQELIGKNILGLTHIINEKNMAIVVANLQKTVVGNGMVTYQVEMVKKNQELIFMEINAVPIQKEGKVVGVLGILRDITDRKQAEEALRESEEKYRLIVENTRDIIFIANVAGEYVYVSPSVKEILGYNQNELVGKLFLSLVHPEDRHILEEETARAGVSGYQTSGDSEYRTRHASGEWRWVVSRGTRVADANGNFLYFIGIMRDITANKQAEKEKQILEEKAQINSRLAAVGEMAAGIAHEINNPLTGVLGFSQMLLENKNVPEDIKENLKLIADGSQRVAEIVKRLLTFARQSKPIKAMANLNELIENTLKLREYVLKTNNINVVTRFDPELPWSIVDPGQMQQVFLNLIVNAEQAMKKAHGKGTLTITTKKIDNNIRILFQDDGPGITRENLGHLFEPFFTTKEPGEGTGLGLSLSRSIVLEHDGKMNVESEFGRGAIFIIDLPIIEALLSEAETAASSVKAQPEATKPGRILVIDDEAGVRTLIEKTLTRMGHSVDVIDDARAALDIIDAGTVYDVILTDVRMPGMSGIELYPLIIRRMPSMKNRIIFITGDVMGLDIRTFLNQNNLPYLSKPFDIELLKEKIAAILKSGQERPDIKCKE
jgi:PAS domain S-box-containing protein